MKKELSLLAISILGFVSTSFAQVSNDNEEGIYQIERHAHGAYRPDEVIVKFKTTSSVRRMAPGRFRSSAVDAVDKVLQELCISEVEPLMPLTGELKRGIPRRVKAFNGKDIEIKDLSKLYTLRLDASKQLSLQEAIEKLQALDDVEFAEPNYLVYLTDQTANSISLDPLVYLQKNISAIRLDKLWKEPIISSKRPVIAILDTGVDITHPDLADNIWTNATEQNGSDGADDDKNGYKDDLHGWDFINQTGKLRDNNGHGTHCAGIAAAVGGNNIGITGANPDAYIMPVAVLQSDGTGDIATIIKGLDYAAANGADVISMSFGGYSSSMAEEQALAHAYANAILVAAAGNDGYCMNHAECNRKLGRNSPMPMFPAAYTFVLGIQATANGGGLTSFSNYDDNGPFFSEYGEDKLYNYELSAPGASIMSTFPGGKYKELNGTSMACPLVAGAVSRLMQCKELGGKEELFGDLINSTTDAGNLDIYKAFQMSNTDRRPSLSLITYNLDDKAGDGDGRADAGETIDIYPVLRNEWGHAKNIRISIVLTETEDPEIVQILNGTADFGFELDSYGKATSANPLRIKINDNCADGRHISLIIKATCDNITSVLSQNIMLKAENGVEIGGIIADDMTLHEGVHYIVTKNLAVPKGVTLTIEPGAILKFKERVSFNCEGTLNAVGTPEKMIHFTSADGENIGYGPLLLNKQTIKYAIIDNVFLDSNSGATEINVRGTLIDCIIKDCYAYWPFGASAIYANCNLTNIKARIKFEGEASFKDCNVIGLIQPDATSFNFASLTNLKKCNTWGHSYGNCLISAFFNSGSVSVLRQTENEQNYLGSSNAAILRKSIVDMDHPIYPKGYGVVDINYVAKTPIAEAHGIVWKVVVNGKDAQDEFEELAPLGVGKHKFEVYFNRPMNKAVAPTITMGLRTPYNSISIAEDGENSGWNAEGTIYTAYLTITGKTRTDGLNRIRVCGAEDNEFFEVPEEKYRFNVMVQKAGSMSTGLMAEAGLGKVTLTWKTEDEDFADLMGYNVYRYESDPEKAKQINTTLIEADATEFIDYDVVPGHTYCYMVKEMGTDLQQHDVSNVVAATPLTAQKGDANGSMTIDVADVVTEVNYLTGQNPQPFIFEAADVNSDETVNILDVVGTVNIIAAPETQSMSVDATATYMVEDGILYVDSDTPLGGVQVNITIKSDNEFEALKGLNGMEQITAWKNDSECLFLAYSMSGKNIGIGKQALLHVGDAEVSNLVASDTKGHNVLAINGSATSIEEMPFGIENWKGAEVRYFDVAGRRISRPAKNQSGVYIQSIYLNDKCVKSYKVMQ